MGDAAVGYQTAKMVAEACLCLQVQRASRAVGRIYDEAFRAIGLNNYQFSLLMMLNRPEPLSVGGIAEALGMDRTTITANLKPLRRDGLVRVIPDPTDARTRRVVLTDDGRERLAQALSLWQKANDGLAARLGQATLGGLRKGLEIIAAAG